MRHIEPNHPHPDKGQIKVYIEGDEIPRLQTSRTGTLSNMTYYELVELLREPYYPNPSGDDKIQKEWVLEYTPSDGHEPMSFRIYDYKTYSLWETMNALTEWSIGGEKGTDAYASELSSLLNTLNSMNKV